ncbi:hypothetical protein [Burkholderia sp. IMCC1007]|uniref:hypothetical protein n=1 Tax=Burkholderia sp. IMCC1007 TaxID=3004104 RepID=UPI0022B2E301|nr:hypothetical protein [Burkholderia sp. IMCC1007]
MPDPNQHKHPHIETQVWADDLQDAKQEAATLRAMFDRLTPFERSMAAKQISAVKRLVEAVEKL